MAGATILLRAGENRAVFSNSIAARLAGIGTAWTRIRAGILYQTNGTGNIVTPNIALGFCAGTTNVYGDATTTHFAGIRTSTSWTDFGGGVLYSGINLTPTKRVGVTTTDAAVSGTSGVAYGAPHAATSRNLLFVDLEKGSPNYTFHLFFRNAGSSVVFPTENNFLEQMGLLAPVFPQHAAGAPRTIPVDEVADGTFDAFNFYWSPVAQTAEVSAVAVSILA